MHALRVVRNDPAGTGLRHLVLDGPAPGHERVGQYVDVGPVGRFVSPFALANLPGRPVELLVKQIGEVATAVGDTPVGEVLSVTDALGPGFPLDAVAGRPLVVLVNGSGISAARPVVAAEVAAGLPRPIHLLYGVFTEEQVSFSADLIRWAAAGVDVDVVLHARGFVQDVAAAEGLVREDVGVVLVGHPGMIAEATRLYMEVGLPEWAILLNF